MYVRAKNKKEPKSFHEKAGIPDGSDVVNFTAPVTFTGNLDACDPFCHSSQGMDDYFDLTGDVGYVSVILTKFADGVGDVYYQKICEIYTIMGPQAEIVSTPTPRRWQFHADG
jgi:hypothetical protein